MVIHFMLVFVLKFLFIHFFFIKKDRIAEIHIYVLQKIKVHNTMNSQRNFDELYFFFICVFSKKVLQKNACYCCFYIYVWRFVCNKTKLCRCQTFAISLEKCLVPSYKSDTKYFYAYKE